MDGSVIALCGLIWVLLSVVSGIIAINKERSFMGFFLLSLLLGPIAGLIMAIIVTPDGAAIDRARAERKQRNDGFSAGNLPGSYP